MGSISYAIVRVAIVPLFFPAHVFVKKTNLNYSHARQPKRPIIFLGDLINIMRYSNTINSCCHSVLYTFDPCSN